MQHKWTPPRSYNKLKIFIYEITVTIKRIKNSLSYIFNDKINITLTFLIYSAKYIMPARLIPTSVYHSRIPRHSCCEMEDWLPRWYWFAARHLQRRKSSHIWYICYFFYNKNFFCFITTMILFTFYKKSLNMYPQISFPSLENYLFRC